VAYQVESDCHKFRINEGRDTALHVAVNDGKVRLVKALVGAILSHEGRGELRSDSALRLTNERGDTPLHLAASRGFIRMCKCIIGENKERNELIKARNKKGETPLFRAVHAGETETFVYLNNVSKELDVTLRNYHGDTILHQAIWREFLDLAILIIHCYPELENATNEVGMTPLKILANKPSAFKSGSNLSRLETILSYCIFVGSLDADKAIKSYMEKVKKYDAPELRENEANIGSNYEEGKHATSSAGFVKSAVRSAFNFLCLGVTAPDLKAIKSTRQKHTWAIQLLHIFMKTPFESYTGGQPFMDVDGDSVPHDVTKQQIELEKQIQQNQQQNQQQKNTKESAAKNQEEETPFVTVAKAGIVDFVKELQNNEPSALHDSTTPENDNLLVVAMKIKYKFREHHVDKKETALLAAARNGIEEIVRDLLLKIPNAVHETNSNNENVLLVAVKNRQTKVVEKLKKIVEKNLFGSLILGVDNSENTVLHLAAGSTSNNVRTWQIAGAAMQMMWDIKWYQYVRTLVPEHLTFRTNNDGKTAGEIFKQNHRDLVNESSDWMKETSNSCSVVAALIAGVSFATSSTVPGGTDNGKPELEGEPAFDAFAIASLIGLCFSVTALIMFLAILTSRKQAQDFQKSLPLKLLLGLSSLFVSIASLLTSFCFAHFFLFKKKYKNILFPVYVATCLPITFYAIVQFPLYIDLLKVILKKLPQPSITSSEF
ncbi:unnamed protein product, partial [Sphenostylis stenocarpa]